MGWSSRQVLGFTALMVGVIITTIVSMVTLVLLLMMGSPPEGEPLLITTPSTTPPTPGEAPPSFLAACEERPTDAFIFLPQPCAIVTSSPSSPSPLSPTVEFLPYFNLRRCSNHMCHGNSCHGNRCCCQATQTSSLAYYCPNERGVLVEDIVVKCGCAPCTDTPVVFVGMVTDTDNTPIPMATVKVDHTHYYQANDDAIFGFSVSSLQEQVTMDISSPGYWVYHRLLTVYPGEVNVLHARLMRRTIRNISPTPHSVIISTLDLRLFDSDLSPLTPVSGVEMLVQFPAGVFSEGGILIGQPVAMGNTASLEGLRMSFISSGDQGEGVRRRRREDGEGVMVFVVSVGMLDVEREEGGRMASQMSGLVSHTLFPLTGVYNCTHLASLTLYLMSDSILLPVAMGNTSCNESGTQIRLTIPLPTSLPLPINLVIGSPQPETCYIAVRAFESTSSSPETQGLNTETQGLSEIFPTEVFVHTTLSGPPNMVNIMIGMTGECVPVPCHGDLVVWISDGLQYTPENYTAYLDDDVIITSDDIATEAEVYSSLSDCEENALTPSAQIYTYFRFIVKSQQPTLMGQPTPNNANLTTPPFCSLRVGVVLSGGVASVYVKATSEVGEGVRMVRVEKIEGGGGEEGEEGSGVCRGCGDSEENTNEFFTCLQVSCDSQVEVGVSREDGKGVCMPQIKGGEGLRVEENKVVLMSAGGKVPGLVVDSFSSNPTVAMEMCKLMTDTSVWFHCIE